MDAELKAVTDAVREVEKALRDTVVAPGRGRSGRVVLADEPALLAAAAALLETLGGFTGGYPDRMTTPGARAVFHRATTELAGLARQFREAEGGSAKEGA
ncbi:hypothetical protein EH183_40490 [Streptomyces sp. CB01881]|uniref:hypothetical protein n=1 Tax=Streptomyces sp. CB01881 TaxID=2078691 RepID=UPI0011E0006C|nr:hypothetical protein [Streptomyces sp. CB01881]TYC68147.1 hypothetical protein EH183_40490 [Streptomyces sp. CB01881]